MATWQDRILKIKIVFIVLIQLLNLRFVKNSPFNQPSKIGYLRGLDFYKPWPFLKTLIFNAHRFNQVHKKCPNLVNPITFNEKMFKSKFFGYFKVPEAGNKLLTQRFIPAHLNSIIACPAIIWQSHSPILPSNEEIKPGSYYLKSNHGSGAVKRINYPLSSNQRKNLQQATTRWLSTPFGLKGGEWWYNAFPTVLLLEEDVCADAESTAWCFYIFSGELAYISAVKKTVNGMQFTWLDESLAPLEYKNGRSLGVKNLEIPASIKEAIHAAKEIGKPFHHVRVDCLFGRDGKFYLNEMTFTTNNALGVRPLKMELWLGSMWKD
jgi:hypothetical protein